MPFVYRYFNTKNGKSYIGITNRLRTRKIEHSSANQNLVFHRAVRKHGIGSFSFEILSEVDSWEEACLEEQKFIRDYDSYRNGYNSTIGGEGSMGLRGETSPASKLTQEIAEAIIFDSCTDTVAAVKYGTTRKNVEAIRKGISWPHLDRSSAPAYKNENHGQKLTENVANKIIEDVCSHKTASEKYGVSSATIQDVRKGKSWKRLDRSNAPTYMKFWEERSCHF